MKKEDVEKLLHDKVEGGEHISPILPEDIKNKSTYIKDICSKLLVNDIIEEYEVL